MTTSGFEPHRAAAGAGRYRWPVVETLWCAVLAAVLLWPQHHRGYGLGLDMVFTPRQPLDHATLGLTGSAPRAVPADLLVALAEHVLGGELTGRIALVVPLLAAGTGVVRLLRATVLPARLAAAGFAIWNPFVVERLALGQWALLWAYGLLPWLVLAAQRLVAAPRERRRWAVLVLLLAGAGIEFAGGVLALLTVLGVLLAERRVRVAAGAFAAWLVLQVPALATAVLSASALTSDPRGVTAFASRSEHGGGVALTLLGSGGVWSGAAVPHSRAGPLAFVALAVLAVAAVLGGRRLLDLLGRRSALGLVTVSAVGFVLALGAAVPGGAAVLRWALDTVPAAGILRDAQKWVLPLVVLQAVLLGAAVDRVCPRRSRAALAGPALVALALPLVLLPDAATAVRATLTPVHYPHEWRPVAAAVDGHGTVVVLPWSAYRSFGWTGHRPVLDPAPRLLDTDVVVDDTVVVGRAGRSPLVVPGEGAWPARVTAALSTTDRVRRLASLGVRWVLVERGTPGTVPALRPDRLTRVYAGRQLVLYRIDGAVGARLAPSAGAVSVVVLAYCLYGLVLGAAAGTVAFAGVHPVVTLRRRIDRSRRCDS